MVHAQQVENSDAEVVHMRWVFQRLLAKLTSYSHCSLPWPCIHPFLES